MGEFLWTGQSAFCRCGHHVEDHYTRTPVLDIWGNLEKSYGCNGSIVPCSAITNVNPITGMASDNETFVVSTNTNTRCKCKEFTPYRLEEPI